MYYAFIQDNKINGVGQCPCLNEEIQNIEIAESVYNSIIEDKDTYIWDGEEIILNPNYEEEKASERESEFNKAFFNTSLGYIRRSVTMADGSKKDFLSDLMPTIKMGLESGIPVNILSYDKPPFDRDIEDWTEYQHKVVVTPQFIQECFIQLSNDFLPINEGVE